MMAAIRISAGSGIVSGMAQSFLKRRGVLGVLLACLPLLVGRSFGSDSFAASTPPPRPVRSMGRGYCCSTCELMANAPYLFAGSAEDRPPPAGVEPRSLFGATG